MVIPFILHYPSFCCLLVMKSVDKLLWLLIMSHKTLVCTHDTLNAAADMMFLPVVYYKQIDLNLMCYITQLFYHVSALLPSAYKQT